MRLRRDRLNVRDVKSGRGFDDEPIVAISDGNDPRIIAIGAAARNQGARCINPFIHERVLIANHVIAEKLLQYAFWMVSGKRWIRVSPIVVVHCLEDLLGGISEVERRQLMELASGAGASETHIWEGRELTDAEVLARVYEAPSNACMDSSRK